MSKKTKNINVHALLNKIKCALDAAPSNGDEAAKTDWNLHRESLANARGGIKLLTGLLKDTVVPCSCAGGLPDLIPDCDHSIPLIK